MHGYEIEHETDRCKVRVLYDGRYLFTVYGRKLQQDPNSEPMMWLRNQDDMPIMWIEKRLIKSEVWE